MGTTPNLALRYPDGTPGVPPDVAGDIRNLATDIDLVLKGGVWAPQLGGGNGAALGSNPVSDGTFFQFGKHLVAKGRITFGSSASFGTGTATISGLPGSSIDQPHSTGSGFFIPVSGAPIPVFFQSVDGANMAIRPVQSSGAGTLAALVAASALGTPAQSSQLQFTLNLTLS